jgi:alkanesulfonate monooxygenase SsuD/methylene tetrahydromethanopterin reductase-like flavin-dependent oxidoreductase (luciferase family)
VVQAAVGHGEEVAPGPGPIAPVELDQRVADVMANARRPGLGREIAAGAGDEGMDCVPPAVGRLPLDLEDAVRREQLDEIVETSAVDAVGVPGDRVADSLAGRDLPTLHPCSLAPLASVTAVRVGASLRTAFIVDDVRVGARWIIERAAAARDAGLDCLLVGDHHAVPVPYYQNTPLLGRLLAEWGDRPFGALFLLPVWNPVLVAEQVGTLASLGPGRFILPLVVGPKDQFAPMGVHVRHRGKHFEAGLDVVRRLLAGEAVTTDEPYRVRDARVSPVPPEPVEVWIGGTHEAAIDRAARLGDGFLADAHLTPEQARSTIELYRERCRAHGRTPTATAIRRDIHVGADAADAERVAGPVVAGGYRGFDPSACTYGSTEQVAERLEEYGAMGYTDVIVRHLAEDQAEVLKSYERLAAVRGALLAT